MAKLIKKSKCKLEAGHIVKGDKIIGIDISVYLQLEKLELMVQQLKYLCSQEPYCAGPSLEGFERKSALKANRPYREAPDTPVIDQRVADAMAFVKEMDECDKTAEINRTIDEFGTLIDWCSSDKFVEGNCFKEIDTPELGDPLAKSGEDIARIIEMIVNNPIVIQE